MHSIGEDPRERAEQRAVPRKPLAPRMGSSAGAKFCSGDPPGDKCVKANGYGVWSLGLQVLATF